ncbi:DUF6265 family protein [Paraurantiacibacter namhicola]|uniref:DUF6265 domain-containing protein n=1 Tax=Paraurantiacibacter namhicola TaxID=645517 RepID=A0A1C7D5D9_9SPHN|nr:DUF6265 family protein [Paraurantiacibacter namhicola]ANU06680.1 hypothetical protein A6F65_00355 [Paraurantiacibacter namhicola]
MTIRHLAAGIALACAALAAPAAAQETRVLGEGEAPPAATLADVAWLQGQWQGEGIGGAPASESWLPATGPLMVGSFVQQDGEGGVMFTEHMYIAETDGSLVVKLKHFDDQLVGWEDKEGMVRFPLVAVEHCAAFFNGLTYRCLDADAGPESGLLVAVRMRQKDGSTSELVFRFYPLGGAASGVGAD